MIQKKAIKMVKDFTAEWVILSALEHQVRVRPRPLTPTCSGQCLKEIISSQLLTTWTSQDESAGLQIIWKTILNNKSSKISRLLMSYFGYLVEFYWTFYLFNSEQVDRQHWGYETFFSICLHNHSLQILTVSYFLIMTTLKSKRVCLRRF